MGAYGRTMTVSSSVSTASFSGSGSTGPFNFTFRCFNEPDHIVVTHTSALGVQTVLDIDDDYTLTFTNNGVNGGSVTLTVALALSEALDIERVLPVTQETDLSNQGAFFLESIEDALDYETMLVQQTGSGVDRAVKAPVGDSTTGLELPARAARLSKLIGTDSNGSITVYEPDDVSLLAVKATIGDLQRALQERFSENWISILDFDDIEEGNASFDNGPGVQAALDSLAGTGVRLHFPEGDWYFQTGISLSGDNLIFGASNSATRFRAAVSAFKLVRGLNNDRAQSGIYFVGFYGFDDSNTSSVAVQLGADSASTTDGNIRFAVVDCYWSTGWYDGIRAEQECDNSAIVNARAPENFGRAFFWGETSATNSSAISAAPLFHGLHVSGQNNRTLGKCKYGIYLKGYEVPSLNGLGIINGFDHCIYIEDASGGNSNSRVIRVNDVHTEEFRPFATLPSARANTTAYSVGNEMFVGLYVFTCKTAGTSAGSAPSFTNTIGVDTTDGTVVWTCVSRYCPRWATGRAALVGELVRATANATSNCGGIYQCTTAGTTAASEPTWPDDYAETVVDGTAVWTLVAFSRGLTFKATNSRRFDISGWRTINHICLVRLEGKASLYGRLIDCGTSSQGDFDVALSCGPLTATVTAIFDGCVLRGNVRPWNVAVTDTFICRVLSQFTTIVNDTVNAVCHDADGSYTAFIADQNYQAAGYTAATGSYSIDWKKDSFVRVTGAATITVGAPTLEQAGRDLTIFMGGSSDVTLNFSGVTVTYRNQTISSLFFSQRDEFVKMRALSDTIVALIGFTPTPSHLRYVNTQAAGTDGGALSSGAWNTCTINSETTDEGGYGTLAANAVTLLPGCYEYSAWATGFVVDKHKLRLRNTTDGATLTDGGTATAPAASQSIVHIPKGIVTITASKTFELQHWVETTNGTNGEGKALNTGGAEIYASLEFNRLF